MSTKVIYFTFNGKLEKAEFSAIDTASEVKDLFRSAAEASPYDILKLYNADKGVINISPYLEPNTPDTPYTLQLVATSAEPLLKEMGTDLASVERRLEALEINIMVENGGLPKSMRHVGDDIQSLNHRLESIEHLSWMGLSKEVNGSQSYKSHHSTADITSNNNYKKPAVTTSSTLHHRIMSTNSSDSEPMMDVETVFEKFHKMRDVELNSEVKGLLEQVNFNNWQWNEPEMLVLLSQMYIDLGFLETFNIPMYGLIRQLDLQHIFSQAELFALLTSAVCHDLDHPGYNNTYQVNARTELAVRYNDVSPLENHHCCVAFKIFANDECNILKNMSDDTYRGVRQCMIRCILATDMAKHNEILDAFKDIISIFDVDNKQHRNQLMMILIKCADISNECRPMEVAEPWIDCLLQEFFNQSDLEKKKGLPVAPYMDRDKVNKSSSQVNFIKFVLLPLFQSLAVIFPSIQDALQYYQRQALPVIPTTAKDKSSKELASQTSNCQSIVIAHSNGTI